MCQLIIILSGCVTVLHNHTYGNGWWCDMLYRECNSDTCTDWEQWQHAFLHSAKFFKLNCFFGWCQKSRFPFSFSSSLFPIRSNLNFLSYEHVFWERSVETGETSIWRPMRRSSGYPRCDPSPPHLSSIHDSSLSRLTKYSRVWCMWKVVSSFVMKSIGY